MSVHQCPKCELRFNFRTELEDHCWHDHPEFRHNYPAVAPAPAPDEPVTTVEHPPAPPHERVHLGDSLVRWVVPRERHH